ncbi:murein L,D-transpeptidase YcbB/YkuD [Flavobacterium sp. CG_23.5]|uniref:L,D-transpeptidase family protein n=1 Tax=Flavobacterium sp. CG_23.5 TaxID=2760708 RepID=UPI001AE7D3C8|nr:L,D-transpeptidase family protein [Flavobacterium sp. CG_23.5]MBP2283455.1 murein L,D-transpeptidase YcbB/YkuD [Flavobacterium sp. CG_23.5]
MKNYVLSIVVVLCGVSVATIYHNRNENLTVKVISVAKKLQEYTFGKSEVPLSKAIVSEFFSKYPDLKKYQSDVIAVYKKRNYKSIWYDEKGLLEFADLLYSKVNLIEEEGLKSNLAYKDKIDGIFDSEFKDELSRTDTEIFLSTMYVFYAKKVFRGIDSKKIKEIGWFLPRKDLSYENLLDSLLVDTKLLSKNEKTLYEQYYKLRDYLKIYRQIEKSGEWTPIEANASVQFYKPSDSSKVIGQIRHRLTVTGDLKQDSKSNVYDNDLMAGVLNYKKRNGYQPNYQISIWQIQRMNVPIKKYIQTIMVNMERCRWIDPALTKSDEIIIINIPAFNLIYRKNGIKELESNLLVGKNITETVVFSSYISSIVFSPYWNIPQSIVENELSLALFADKDYLAKHNMESNKGKVRQKPGGKNPMGLVKFMFPNTNDIYLHDTPSKSLFEFNYRALSHGCINMDKAKELAVLLLKNDPEWPIERINEAMKGEKETTYILKKKIPLYIGYFTSWVDDKGEIHFYEDIYDRDERLASLLYEED